MSADSAKRTHDKPFSLSVYKLKEKEAPYCSLTWSTVMKSTTIPIHQFENVHGVKNKGRIQRLKFRGRFCFSRKAVSP
ncbi:hypothetical protein P5673_006105 [Acropora cervicornis]|uniref:Uncharacterized protein n=1 Tax=Acropora cervicornis TaxID=6130 RepID=A0AAD9QXG5_ACRCE|nr:hypothetical protein P5673_006105 [Acropora cervicornis]